MAMKTFPKDPDEELDYSIDWTDWLDGDTIVSSAWTVPAGLTKEVETNTTTGATVWVSSGSNGQTYNLINRIVTAGGRTGERSINVTLGEN